jgi:hypothetical protein
MPILQAQQTGMIGPSARESAMATTNQRNTSLTNLNKVGGKKSKSKSKSKSKGGSPATITVPVVPNANLINDPSKGTSQGINSQITAGTKVTATSDANSALDHNAKLTPIPSGTKVGGSILNKFKRFMKSIGKKTKSKGRRTKSKSRRVKGKSRRTKR